jgi:EmrB/QacA subfamily drug resistance transporter
VVRQMVHSGSPLQGESPASTGCSRPRLALAVLSLVLFVTFLDNTIVAVALASIQSHLHAGITALQWVVSGYALTFAALMLTFGTLGDHFGRRRVMVAGLVVFTLGSVLGLLAPSVGVLIAARVVMGIGAAASEPGTLSMIRQLYPDRAERAQALGVWSAVSGLALAAGPLVGGTLIGLWDWRGIFAFNIAIGVVALAGVRFVLPEIMTPRRARLDVPGFFWGAVALTSATFATIAGETSGYGTWWVAGLFLLALVALALFVRSELRAEEPVLDLRAFRHPAFTGGMITAFTGFFAVFAVFFFVPLFVQLLGNATGFDVVVDFVPMAVCLIASSALSGRWIARVGAGIPIAVGCFLAAAGILITNAFISPSSSWSLFGWSLAIVGTGLGMVSVGSTTSVLGSVKSERSGMAASAVNTSRELGAVAGVAILGAIIYGQLTHNLLHRLAQVPGLPASIRNQVVVAVTTGNTNSSGLPKTGPIAHIVDEVIGAAQQSFQAGLNLVMLMAGALMLLSGLLAMALIHQWRVEHRLDRTKPEGDDLAQWGGR